MVQYQGGKHRLAKTIRDVITIHSEPDKLYLEPFVGGGSVLEAVAPRHTGPIIASDVNGALITMYQHLMNGWEPPSVVTEEMYAEYKKTPNEDDPMTAFVLIGCSWGGVYYSGYARNNRGDNYAKQSKNSLLRKREVYARHGGIEFRVCDYTDYRDVENAVIYCDPPYNGTVGYKNADRFDHDQFWDMVRHWSKRNVVFVSEQSAPDDMSVVWEHEYIRGYRNAKNEPLRVIERIYSYSGN